MPLSCARPFWLLAAVVGCSGSHTSVVDAGPALDADSGMPPDPAVCEVGPPSEWALPRAEGGASPPSTEPDAAPGERPSDGPEAATWRMPPPPDESDAPCCERIGEARPLEEAVPQAGFPQVEWTGDSWGVAWMSFCAHSHATLTGFQRLGTDGRPIASARTHVHIGPVRLEWADGRYGLLAAGPPTVDPRLVTSVGVLDADGTLRAGMEPLAGSTGFGGLTRLPLAHRWVAAVTEEVEGAESSVALVAFDDEHSTVGYRRDLARTPGLPGITSYVSRSAVVWPAEEGVLMLATSWPHDDMMGEPFHVMALHTWFSESDAFDTSLAIASVALRDLTIVAGVDASHLHTAVADPFAETAVGATHEIDATPEVEHPPGMAANDQLGLVALCYASGPGPYGGYERGVPPPPSDTLRLAIVGPDGRRRGAPIDVLTDRAHVRGCDVAWNGDELLVVAEAATGGGEPHLWTQRVRFRE